MTRIVAILNAPGNNSNVIMGWFTGPLVGEVEGMPLDAFKRGVMLVLRRFFGKKCKVTEPVEVLR